MFIKEKNKLFKCLFGSNSDVIELFRKSKVIIAGGALTSIFSNKEINDIDVYFRSYHDLEVFINNVYRPDGWEESASDVEWADVSPFCLTNCSMTEKSILFVKDNLKVQCIHFKFFESAEQIFDTFDFSINMCAFDFATEEFVFKDSFLNDLAARRLVINTNTVFPIISMLRVNKYLDRSYNISKKEIMKLGLAISNLKLNSWDDVIDQLGSMYGVDVSKFFDKSKDFTMESAIEQLDAVEENEDFVFDTEAKSRTHLITKIKEYHGEAKQTKFYKKVWKSSSGELTSPCRTTFKWKIGEIHDGGQCGLWMCFDSIEAWAYMPNYRSKYEQHVLELEAMPGSEIEYLSDGHINVKGPVKAVRIVK